MSRQREQGRGGRGALMRIVLAGAWLMSAGSVMGQAIARRPASQPAGGMAASRPAATDSDISAYSAGRVVLALGLVIGGILILRWCGVRVMGGGKARASGAVSVVGRTLISPRQQLLLVQVGRRLVLVGNSGGHMNPLCEIRDPDEVAEVIGQLRSEKSDSAAKGFSSLLGGIGEKFQREVNKGEEIHSGVLPEQGETGDDRRDLAETRQELEGLREKMQGLARTLGK